MSRQQSSIPKSKIQHTRWTINIFKDGTFAYVMEKKNSIDIDSDFEFEVAELLIQKKN